VGTGESITTTRWRTDHERLVLQASPPAEKRGRFFWRSAARLGAALAARKAQLRALHEFLELELRAQVRPDAFGAVAAAAIGYRARAGGRLSLALGVGLFGPGGSVSVFHVVFLCVAPR